MPRKSWFVLLLAAACSPVGVSGSIDGARVGGARDAIYDTVGVDIPFLGDIEVTIVILTDFPDACATFESFYDEAIGTCDDVCEEYTQLQQELHLNQEGYWSTVLTVNTSDGTDGTFTFDTNPDDGEFAAGYNAYDAVPLRDAGDCEDACDDGELLVPDSEGAEEGELEMAAKDDRLTGKFDVNFGGEDGLRGSFSAAPCDMGDWGAFSYLGF